MRRLLKHALAGVGASTFVVTAGVAGLSSPAATEIADAVPATQPVPVATTSNPTPTPAPTLGNASTIALTADQAERRTSTATASTAAAQAKVTAALTKQAKSRYSKLSTDDTSIARQRKKMKAAAAAQARILADRGYEPGVTDPREMARQILANKFDYEPSQFTCFDSIIMRESKWSITATNRSSGAYGIPQALPGSKMATVGSDWRTNPATQIIWAVGYMQKRYGSPCGAWGFKSGHGWY